MRGVCNGEKEGERIDSGDDSINQGVIINEGQYQSASTTDSQRLSSIVNEQRGSTQVNARKWQIIMSQRKSLRDRPNTKSQGQRDQHASSESTIVNDSNRVKEYMIVVHQRGQRSPRKSMKSTKVIKSQQEQKSNG